jgi:hypothetical protein
MARHLNSDVQSFVNNWVARHVRAERGLSANPVEIDRLAAGLTGAARAEGISGGELHRVLGDIDDYLAEQCQKPAPAA